VRYIIKVPPELIAVMYKFKYALLIDKIYIMYCISNKEYYCEFTR